MKKHDIFLGVGVIVSSVLIFIFEFSAAKDSPELFTNGQKLADILVNLSLSYIAGWIIYMISTFIPQLQEENKSKRIVFRLLTTIVGSFNASIHNSILYPNKECRSTASLSINELGDLIDYSILNVEITGINFEFEKLDIKPITYIDQLILSTTLPLESQLNEIKPYYHIISHDIIKLLLNIEDSLYLHFVGGRLKYQRNFVFDKVLFLDLYQLIRDLEGHIAKLDSVYHNARYIQF